MSYIFVGDEIKKAEEKAEKLGLNIRVIELEPAKWLSPNVAQKVAREIKKFDEVGNEYYELLVVWFSDIWCEENEENTPV